MDNRTIDEIRENENKLIIEIKQLEQENKELKKQLEKKYEKVGTLTGELLYEENTKLINQQKEFIEWLENKMKETHYTMFEFQAYRLVFEKYKEIVGVEDE